MKIAIIGAGMAGLVAANMLRRHEVTVIEKAATLPHNHTALLRFRTTAVSDATGIPFSRERVLKGLWDGEKVINKPTLAFVNRYSANVTQGELHQRSILSLESVERWVAPPDFIELMARNLDIHFDHSFDFSQRIKRAEYVPETMPIISTVPMPFMMQIFGWKDKPEFKFQPVWTIKATLVKPVSTICQTLYNTEPMEWYRATIHGQQLTLEFMFDPDKVFTSPLHACSEAFDRFFNTNEHCDSIIEGAQVNKIGIGKIRPIDERIRKRFMLWLTEKYNIYSLGRFATWRNILLDDVANDVHRIEVMIEQGHTYNERKNL
jgi:hypothetical protein